ncbi:MAG: hypothetical protein WBM90_10560 [Acidimicrobiia bacterium]
MGDGTRNRWIAVGATVVLVAVLAIVAVNREPVQLDPSSPEGVVQGYLQAISDKDYEAAAMALDPEFYEDCNPGSIARSTPSEPFTATLQEPDSAEPAGNAFVQVTLRFGNEGVFGGAWTSFEEFHLIDSGGSWLITGDAWPYFSWDCENV